jgi:hypothetical protein
VRDVSGGQSNMQYTPHSMAGMNNLTAELAAADGYPDIRFFTVGQDGRGPYSHSARSFAVVHGDSLCKTERGEA